MWERESPPQNMVFREISDEVSKNANTKTYTHTPTKCNTLHSSATLKFFRERPTHERAEEQLEELESTQKLAAIMARPSHEDGTALPAAGAAAASCSSLCVAAAPPSGPSPFSPWSPCSCTPKSSQSCRVASGSRCRHGLRGGGEACVRSRRHGRGRCGARANDEDQRPCFDIGAGDAAA